VEVSILFSASIVKTKWAKAGVMSYPAALLPNHMVPSQLIAWRPIPILTHHMTYTVDHFALSPHTHPECDDCNECWNIRCGWTAKAEVTHNMSLFLKALKRKCTRHTFTVQTWLQVSIKHF
jgi:hypothetical protein